MTKHYHQKQVLQQITSLLHVVGYALSAEMAPVHFGQSDKSVAFLWLYGVDRTISLS